MEGTVTVNEEKLWQMLELVASPDCDISTETLSLALGKLINGDEATKEEGIRILLNEMNKYLP